jgi:hypothetical protein
MSGGSYDYMYFKIEDTYSEKTYDIELDEMIIDLCNVLHDLEWWQSGDSGEEKYRKTLQQFKDKWFGNRDKKLRELVIQEFDKFKISIEKL